MSDGWKLAVLKRRRAFLAEELARMRRSGLSAKHDQREHDALDWAIPILEDELQYLQEEEASHA